MMRISLVSLFLLALSGCQVLEQLSSIQPVQSSRSATAEDWVQATGYAQISTQPGETEEQRQLNAMRVSKLRAYQELAGIINGQYLYGTTTVESMILQSDEFKTAVAGVVRGARVVKSFPVQKDVYATILEVDLNRVERAWNSTR